MRHVMSTHNIGDGVMLATVAGVVAEIGTVRQYDALNPCDVGIPLPVVNVDALFPSVVLVPDTKLSAYFPMTSHQRLYQWPNTGVGPITYFSEPSGWGVALPPVEVPPVQSDWPLQPLTAVPIRPADSESPKWRQDVITQTVLPQRGNSTREFWTFYQTHPWAPTAFISNMLLEGDTRKFYIRGVTRNNLGAALAGVSVRCLLSKLVSPVTLANPIIAEVVSDGSGNYEFGVAPQLAYELIAYHETNNVGGITLDDLQADVSVDIYCTQPGVAPSAGGSPVFGDMTGGLQ
jgi:hypothetical protein